MNIVDLQKETGDMNDRINEVGKDILDDRVQPMTKHHHAN